MEDTQGMIGANRDRSHEDPFKLLKIRLNPDGSLTRSATFPVTGPNSSPDASVVSKDVPLDPLRETWVRVFRPNPAQDGLPIIVYFHGGGFIIFSAASQPFHLSCERMASDIPAVLVSVEYRLAPEHPLPAAYEDAADALRWLARDAPRDPWLQSADFSRCFVMGSSAGGNIAFHAALHAVESQVIKLAGVVLNQPYFGGNERTASELRLAHDHILPLSANDLMWKLSLPAGADRDHEFSNPVGSGERAARLPRCLITGHGQDPLVDRQLALVRLLEDRSVSTTSSFDDDGFHGVELFDPAKARQFFEQVKAFVSSTPSSHL